MRRLRFISALIYLPLLGLLVFSSSNYRQLKDRNVYPNSRIDTFNVVHYTINITKVNFNNRTLEGFTDLQVVLNMDQVDTILIDFIKMDVDSIWVEEISIASFVYDKRWIKVPLPYQYDKGTSLQVSVFYHGKPATDPAWGGFYFSGKTAYNMGVGMQSYPHNFGRAWYPCVDNFTDKATYDYYITVEDELTAVCSGVLEEIFPNNDGTVTFHWSMKQEIPTYISSVAISDYIVLNDTINGKYKPVVSSIYVSPSDSINAVSSFRELPKYVNHLEELLGPYMWDRIGFVAVPFSGGAMEHACNIAISKSSVDGTTDHEMLFVHELAHSWFGNLVTCRRAEDMWLNEGLASYAEALYIELEEGKDMFKNYVRKNHKNVLQMAHIRDEGYYPVAGVPHHLTYSSTVYNKGASVAHTLRGYLGDENFFTALKSYSEQFAFKDISTNEFKDFIGAVAETDLNDFFNGWVFSPGFPHFSIDSFTVAWTTSGYKVRLFLRQKLKGTDMFTFSNLIDITFMDNNWNSYTITAGISGEKSELSVLLPFLPSVAMIDLEEKIADATTDSHLIIDSIGEFGFEDTFCTIRVKEVEDSILLRVIHNWVAPDDFSEVREDQELSKSRYWRIEGVFPGAFSASGTFIYNRGKSNRNGWLDTDLEIHSRESMIMYYRENSAAEWERCDFSIHGDSISGEITINNLLPGEYALGRYVSR